MAKEPIRTKTGKAPERRDADPSAGDIAGVSDSKPGPAPHPVVGVGASAGGLEAFTALLTALPADTGMTFVLIQHMDPVHKSVLTTLLQKATAMQVEEVTDGMTVEPDHVYVIPPNSLMTISRGVLALTPRHQRSVRNLPIDYFFQALADDLQSRAIGVVLSGTASDGTLGLKAIKAKGGVTFAQDSASARHPGMPESAVAAGCVDFTMPPGGIAAELARINSHPYFRGVAARVSLPADAGEGVLQAICHQLRTATGVDFVLYKPATISRRVARRMALRKMETQEDYLRLLIGDRAELNALYEDIFIHVTSFFRDPDCLLALQQLVLSGLPCKEPAARTIRIWVPGCSSGEEVYSIAMLLVEQLGERRNRATIQFFGTDISDSAIEQARAGVYPESSLSDVSPERQRRFFNRVEKGFQIAKSLRDLCVFARHNVTRDPPFSKLDLISCRNVLIYMGLVLQKRTMEIFHYALKPDGHLMLGKSESLSGYSNLFSVDDSKHKIFSRRPFTRPLSPHSASRGGMGPVKRGGAEPAPIDGDSGGATFDLRREAERILLNQYAPAALVVDPTLQIIQFQGNIAAFLAPAAGEPSFHLLKMVRPELVADLRAAIHKVKKEGVAVRKDGIRFRQNGTSASVDIQVSPLKGRHAGEFDFLVVFEEAPKPESADTKPPLTRLKTKGTKAELERRDRELASLQEQLRSMVQDHAAGSEEMQAMNEELLSANEELQSTNEELETAKEELESSNEELTTLNDESQKRNAELSLLTDDLNNVLTGVSIPILIIDVDLRIRRFTPLAGKVFNLIAADAGRPLTDIASTLDVIDWPDVASQVINKGEVVEREARARDGRWYTIQMRPYRTGEQKISGLLISLLDIDAVKRSLDEAGEARDFAEAIVETVREPLLVLDAELRIVRATESFYRTFQVSKQDTEGQILFDLGNGQWDIVLSNAG